ncbi:MAG: hypothetical protein B7Y25_07020 [Alphaproteobacteria bacterium 16-39-46]|nr:MAG: hypothetical protein B7Y25_07020 [Alphaproteobacteria bacterium 16-39-46]OZA43978.1 MAG: hypothetical protein B7X84_01815 [Alphaproteobacteria bacterium 17-39-52]HQS83441.1 hypothetical protein [Alphaproteobacteria bacterium]HQS93235.1 hypothetical protein [Alphaproteobacteria bacterium]
MRRKIFSKNINLKFLHRAFLTHALFFACLSPFETHAMEDRGACQDDETQEIFSSQQVSPVLAVSSSEIEEAAATSGMLLVIPQTSQVDPEGELRKTFRELLERFFLLQTQRPDLFHAAVASLTSSFSDKNLFSQCLIYWDLFQRRQAGALFSFQPHLSLSLVPLGAHAMENRGAAQADKIQEIFSGQQQMRSFLEFSSGDSGAGAAAASYTFSAPHQTFRDDRADELRRTFRESHVISSILETQRSPLFHDAAASLTDSFRHENLFSHRLKNPLNFFQEQAERDPFSFERHSMAGGRPPSPDILKEIQRYRLSEDVIHNIYTDGNFVRGNIQSFLENIRHYMRDSMPYFRDLRPFINRNLSFLDDDEARLREAQRAAGEVGRDFTQEDARNLENVMKAARIKRTKDSIEIIYALLSGREIDEELCIREFRLYLEHLKKGPRYASFGRRNGMNEVDNTFFTLERLGHFGDNDSILLGDAQVYINLDDGTPVTMKSLLAKTWWLIHRQFNETQQDVLKESLVKALGQCIEDDEHRVCNVGKSQRIVTVLQGYVEGIKTDDVHISPEPNTFLSAFFSSKQEEIMVAMEETPQEKRIYARKLFREIKTTAEEVYRDTPEKMKEVLGNTMDFLRLSFEMRDADLEEHEFSINLSSSIQRWRTERLRAFDQGRGLARRYGYEDALLSGIFPSSDFVKGNIQSFLASESFLIRDSSYYDLSSLISSLYLIEGDLSEAQEEARKLARLTQTKTKIQTLYSFLRGHEIDEELCLQEFYLFLEHLQTKKRDDYKRVNGMNEIDNAFSMLEGLRQPGEHDSILSGRKMDLVLESGESVNMKSLLAKIWWLMNRQDMFKERLVRALGHCIEDDGHRVSDIEKLEKISSVLQSDIERIRTEGFMILPEPDPFLSAFFSPKRQEMTSVMERPQEERSAYGHQLFEAIKVAVEDIYRDAPDKKREIDKKASQFLKISLGL